MSTGLRELRRGVVEYCVLALVRKRPMYGFELVQVLKECGRLVTSLGTIYPLLNRLRTDGLVSTTTRSTDSAPTRRYYEITAAGEQVLSDFVVEWRAFRQSVDALIGSDSPAVEGFAS